MLVSYKDATHCYYCEAPFSFTTIKTKDHIIPKSKGGRGGANIIAACRFCNTNKGSRTLDDFFNYMLNRKTKRGFQHDRTEIILQNISKLKSYLNGCHIELDPVLKTHKGLSVRNISPPINLNEHVTIIKQRDWFSKCIFKDDFRATMFAETVHIIECAKKRKLTHYEGIELYEKIILDKHKKPSPNFHEDAPENQTPTIN